MKNLLLTIIFHILVTNISIAQDEFLVIVNKKLDTQEQIIESLNKKNKELESQISTLIQKNKKHSQAKKELDSRIKELYYNRFILQKKESELELLKQSISNMYTSNEKLNLRISSLSKNLNQIKEAYKIKDIELTESLKKIDKLNLLVNAKNEAIERLIFKEKNVIYFDLANNSGEQLEQNTGWSFYRNEGFCHSFGKELCILVSFPGEEETKSINFGNIGDYKAFNHNGILIKITYVNKLREPTKFRLKIEKVYNRP